MHIYPTEGSLVIPSAYLQISLEDKTQLLEKL